jgi:hypothetical protein
MARVAGGGRRGARPARRGRHLLLRGAPLRRTFGHAHFRGGAPAAAGHRLRPVETHTRSRKFGAPTASDLDIFRTAWALFRAESWAGRPVRLIGIGISGWDGTRPGVQQDLFDAQVLRRHGSVATRKRFRRAHSTKAPTAPMPVQMA